MMAVTDREFESLQGEVRQLRTDLTSLARESAEERGELRDTLTRMTAWQAIAPWVSIIVIGLTGLGMVLAK